MTKIAFKVSARAGKLLGRENFSNPEGAIIELVKNSYDADAKNCLVLFDIPTKKVKDSDGKEIEIPVKEKSILYIIDNGEGMTEKVIKDHWMQIGTGNKEKDYISDDKRTKTGAKGIGRFALDRLGFETEMWTLSKKAKDGIGSFWKMDWNQFDNADKAISQIEAELKSEKIDLKSKIKSLTNDNVLIEKVIRDLNFDRGTIIKIAHLKDDWFNEETSSVFKSLEALIPPKELNIPFEVFFKHFQQPKEFGKVDTAFFNDFDYKLKASYDAENLNVDFEITRNEIDIKSLKKNYPNVYKNKSHPYDLQSLENKTFQYSKSIDKVLEWKLNSSNRKLLKEVGSFDFTFFYLKLTNSLKEGYPYKTISASERKSILKRFGGVKIYRDSFRVRPYGDPNNDWLRLGYRAAQSPAGPGQRIGDWRVRPESTAGIITISRSTNPLLVDKADRGALQENETFEIFKLILTGIISEFEYDRTKILNPIYLEQKKKAKEKRESEIQKRAEALANKIIEKRKKVEESIYGKKGKTDLFEEKKEEEEKKTYEEAFKDTFKAIDDEKAEQENQEIVQVRSLASLGLVVSSFAHELKEIKDNAIEIKELEVLFKSIVPEEKKKSVEYKDGIDIIELLDENSDKIIHWVDYALTAIKKDKRTRGKFEFSGFLKSLNKSWSRIFKKKDISLNIVDETKDKPYDFRAFEMDISTIFTNLINNSIDSFNNLIEVQERTINISAKVKDDSIEILYSDNGVGLDEVFEDKEEIFLPFKTAKRDRKGKEIGTGLGMYLVKSVIDDNNGTIDILEPEKGFSVMISFPLRK
ncbi:histidine kinase/DNA gyrase B/HSP90-like ATPase [Oceanihabitans sediminis]|jgi:signal transduction histidine kinase|uniref:histidine kinase n=1 Tax=Oceanihabitans sediminis TaxID=1812012 RepID=A0A368P4Y3_9FLAO|nr:sensor histidine kinase [Oceanihabitans sediminis]RBP26939.1 histidine kinase/DNA gyrase B/HSP90-like ATPase [Oceanihabitans sediminis]RCU56965.1 GHKL domain-containing protein [Oceanihabitans sediminis]